MDGVRKLVPGHRGYEVEHNMIYGHRLLFNGKPATPFWYNGVDAAKIMLEWKRPMQQLRRTPSFMDIIMVSVIIAAFHHYVLGFFTWWQFGLMAIITVLGFAFIERLVKW